MGRLDQTLARQFARIALGHVAREYPHKLDHVLTCDADAQSPRTLHPVFYGSFDWHSCVHGWWTLLTLRRLFPDMAESALITELAQSSFTEDKLAVELAYIERPNSAGFERPYGWGWLLYLHLEASRHPDQPWAARLEPLARTFALRFERYIEILTYPIRVGTHFNSAFALTLAAEWADEFDPILAAKISAKARAWFAEDRACQAWEPGGDEFLSPALSEAMIMQQALDTPEFANWFREFLPDIATQRPATLFSPVVVSDRSDGKIAHLDGLNLSRAWSWRTLAKSAPDAEALILQTATKHLDAAMEHISGDYMGEHWLASFALLALMVE